jgi:hypothetical protein
MAIYKADEMGACMEELQQPALPDLRSPAGTAPYIPHNLCPRVELAINESKQ